MNSTTPIVDRDHWTNKELFEVAEVTTWHELERWYAEFSSLASEAPIFRDSIEARSTPQGMLSGAILYLVDSIKERFKKL